MSAGDQMEDSGALRSLDRSEPSRGYLRIGMAWRFIAHQPEAPVRVLHRTPTRSAREGLDEPRRLTAPSPRQTGLAPQQHHDIWRPRNPYAWRPKALLGVALNPAGKARIGSHCVSHLPILPAFSITPNVPVTARSPSGKDCALA